jgi:SAM-dependent methyltransferase
MLDDPQFVLREYENEEGLATRRAFGRVWRGAIPGRWHSTPWPKSGRRAFSKSGRAPMSSPNASADLGAEVTAVDTSPRMVELARTRGVDARLGDVQNLEFEDDSFDCAVAAWMLYHVPNLDRGLGQLARVLRPGGRLVAITNSEKNLAELWSLLGPEGKIELAFNCENGVAVLGRHFPHVRRQEAAGSVTIPTREDAHRYVSATLVRRQLADRLPEKGWPLVATRINCVFVAEKAVA